jgi:hypothetical protein
MTQNLLTSQQVLNLSKNLIESLTVNEDGELLVAGGGGGSSGVKTIYAEHNFNASVSGQEIPFPEEGVVFLQFWGNHDTNIYLSTKVEGVLGPRAQILASIPADIGPLVVGPECPNHLSGPNTVGTVTVWVLA